MKKRASLFTLWETHWPKIVAAISASSVAIVVAALYINLPLRMASAEKKNEQQDKILERLDFIAQQNQQLIANQQRQADTTEAHSIQILWDKEAKRAYCDDGKQTWWVNDKGTCE